MITKFYLGEKVNIEDLDEEKAIIVFGRKVYEAWKKNRERIVVSKMKVSDIDHDNNTVSFISDD
jgi:F0F1-type ATP synthase gamma subunit